VKPATRLIALLWLIIGSLTWHQVFQGASVSASLKFFATLQVLGAIALLAGFGIGYFVLITMSAFTMVSGILALIAVMFMPATELEKGPSLGGIPPRGVLAGLALVAVVLGRLCWLGLRRDPPAGWASQAEE